MSPPLDSVALVQFSTIDVLILNNESLSSFIIHWIQYEMIVIL
jgi:hypothetical protein